MCYHILSYHMQPKRPWQQRHYSTNLPFPVPDRNIRHSRAPPHSAKEKTNQRKPKESQRKGKGKRTHSGAGPAPPPPRFLLKVGLGPPPPPCTQPSCPARKSVPPPWLARPRTFSGQREHAGVSSHTPSLSLPHLLRLRGPGSTPRYQVEPGLSFTAPAPPALVARDLANLAALGARRGAGNSGLPRPFSPVVARGRCCCSSVVCIACRA